MHFAWFRWISNRIFQTFFAWVDEEVDNLSEPVDGVEDDVGEGFRLSGVQCLLVVQMALWHNQDSTTFKNSLRIVLANLDLSWNFKSLNAAKGLG